MSTIISRIKGVATLLRLIFRSDPWRAALALSPVIPVAAGLSFVAARNLLVALARDDRGGIAAAAVLFAGAFVASSWLGRVVRTTRIHLGELTATRFHLRRLDAVLAPSTVSHLDRPDYLDRLEILRSRAFDIGQAPRMLGWLVDSGGGIIVSIALLLSVRPVLALVVLGGVAPAYFNARAQRRVEAAREANAIRARRAVHLYDVATKDTHAKEVRVSRLGDELLRRYSSEWRSADRSLLRSELAAGVVQVTGWALQVAVFGLGVVALVGGVRGGSIDPGDLFLALGAMGLVVGQFSQAAGGLSSVGRISRLFEHLDAIEQEAVRGVGSGSRGHTSAPAPAPDRLQRGITLRDVSFRYPGSSDDALAGVDLHLPAGSVVALVGENGAGKSTLVKLLFGLYRPTSGEVLVDGGDIEVLDPDEWRTRTAACFQDFVRFELLALESVGAGDLPYVEDRDRVGAALSRAAAGEVVSALPSGLDTQLGPRFGGHDLSGGQWQRLALARALMRQQPLLIALDEPAAALDALAEQEIFRIYASAAREQAPRTGAITVLVSHRYSTVRAADLIVVLHEGRVVEAGSHDELVNADGAYAELYELQAKYYR